MGAYHEIMTQDANGTTWTLVPDHTDFIWVMHDWGEAHILFFPWSILLASILLLAVVVYLWSKWGHPPTT